MGRHTLREAQRADISALVGLASMLWREHQGADAEFRVNPAAGAIYRRWLKRNSRQSDCRVLVAEEDGRLVGMATAVIAEAQLYWPARYGFIRDVYVLPDRRRRGIGMKLVDELIGWLRLREVARVELVALSANMEARQFWEKLGFSAKFLIYHRPL